MIQYWRAKTSEFLSHANIEYEESGDALKVSRDSIVAKVEGEWEEDSYNNLLVELKKEFNQRYFFAMKNDDFLWLDIIGK